MTAKMLLKLVKEQIAKMRKVEKVTFADSPEAQREAIDITWELINLARTTNKMWYAGELTDLQYQRIIDLLGEEDVW